VQGACVAQELTLAGITHNDILMRNIVVKEGHVCLIDWDIATVDEAGGNEFLQTFLEENRLMEPERLFNKYYDSLC